MKLLANTVARLYYRILVHGALPRRRGGILFVGLHRNGAIDGWVHLAALGGNLVFLVGANLKRNPFTRPFAVGIAVERGKDPGDRSGNPAALRTAVEWLRGGGDLFVYPEGTSALGPAPLPFHRGAARIACAARDNGIDIRIVPVGIDYEKPETPGSHVDVIVGAAVNLPQNEPQTDALIDKAHAAISQALLSVAFVFADEASQQRARQAVAPLGRTRPAARAASLSRLAVAGPPLQITAEPGPKPPHHAPFGIFVARAAVIAGIFCNLPVVAGAWFLAEKMADGPNVVALWRIVSGLFLLPLWLAVSLFTSLAFSATAGLLVVAAQIAVGIFALRNAYAAMGMAS